jgi:hypothetical protein
MALPNAASLQLSSNYYWSDDYKLEGNELLVQEAYGQLGASLSYVSPSGTWKVTGWGRNLTDKWRIANGQFSSFGLVLVDAPPREYGINFTWFAGR